MEDNSPFKEKKDEKKSKVKTILIKIGRFSLELLKTTVVVLVLAFLIRYFLIQPFQVEGASMEPSLAADDYLLAEKFTLYFKGPERGAIIIFKAPNSTKISYIKRVIGLPREKVVIKNHEVIIYNNHHPDGIILSEDYLSPEVITNGDSEVQLKEDEYYVLGDNRENSSDSREWGIIHKKDIQGKAWLIIKPLSEFGPIPKVKYSD